MAISKTAVVSFLVLSLLLVSHLVEAQDDFGFINAGAKIDCGGACKGRCALSKRPRLCNRACGSCCSRCHCVPPGTSGHHEFCPCYAALTTHAGKKKCP